ncbi:MAG TPA: hypothetical protein RMH26_32195, partial [Polyangiaceae bacterium LLY-WYZ-15_(1-7)]|nr:hypothetical protein [Polyangiaceae bacterium LLY-WYZ-15_(1-7)]
EDWQDVDSDNDGIPDADESTADTDGDGRPDFADTDDDNDRVVDASELAGGGPGVDTDGDGIPDFKDPDSDDDAILDGDERDVDTDMDGLEDWQDVDSDNDGIPDSEEAGDLDIFTPPVDTDMDMIPDFRDPDSDNDGISDQAEREAGTDPLLTDTDMDGVSDLIEVGAGTDPLDMGDNPRTRGDFVFVVPFEEAPMPERDTLQFRTNIQIADVYFLFDTTGSMSGEIAAMRDAVRNIITNLVCEDFGTACMGDDECAGGQVCSLAGRCIEDPTMSSCVASVFTGIGTYEGFASSYRNRLSLQNDPDVTRSRIPATASGDGGRESLYESVACVADPSVCSGAMCAGGGIGCPAYRMEAVRILVTITDEPDECGDCSADSPGAAGMRLLDQGITFVGVDADSGHEPRANLRAIANNSDSLDSGGAPLVYDGDGAGVTTAVTDAINEIVNGVPIRVTIEATDEPGDDGDALQFIDYLEVNTSGDPAGCSMVSPTEDTDGDTYDDAFPSLTPGTSVCWDVVPITNDIVEPGTAPLVFEARLTVFGDGSPLDSRQVYFLVPPEIEIPVGPM